MAVSFLSNDWRRPSCGDACHIKYVLLPGMVGREPLERHDPETHEMWGALHAGTVEIRAVVETGPLRIDLYAREVTVSGKPARVGAGEWALLSTLARHVGRRFSTRELAMLLRGPEFVGADELHLVRMVVYRLRRHLREAAPLLDSHQHSGYCLLDRPTSLVLAPKVRRWSIKYDACVQCGTTERFHNSHGLCSGCSPRPSRARRRATRP